MSAHALVEFEWALKLVATVGDGDKGLHYDMMLAQYPGRVIVKPLDEHIGDLVYLKQQEYVNVLTSRYSLHTSSWEELNAGDLIGSEAEFAKWGLKTCTLDDIKVAKAPFAMPISITPRFLEWTVRRLETRC
ncbi:hypothetical protein PRIC2_001571 [Phytophthora ramorum]